MRWSGLGGLSVQYEHWRKWTEGMAGTAVTSTASTTHSQILDGFVQFKVWIQFWYWRGNSNGYIVPRIIWGLRNFLLDGTIPRRTRTNIYSLQIGDQWSSDNTTNVQPDELVSLLELAYRRWVRGNLQEQKWLKGHCIKESPSHSGGVANKSRKQRAHCTERAALHAGQHLQATHWSSAHPKQHIQLKTFFTTR